MALITPRWFPFFVHFFTGKAGKMHKWDFRNTYYGST